MDFIAPPTIGLIDASREAGREDVTSDPSSYGLQATSGSGSNSNSSNVPTSLAGLIEIYRDHPVSDSESAIAGAIYYPSETELLYYDGDTSNVSETYSWDKDTQTLSAYDAINDLNYRVVYEFLETSDTSIYMFIYRWYLMLQMLSVVLIPMKVWLCTMRMVTLMKIQ